MNLKPAGKKTKKKKIQSNLPHDVTSIEQSPVSKGHPFLILL